jgi:hypothetical protein
MSTKLHRRTVLRSLCGLALALPALEAMMPKRARADVPGIPKRFLVAFGGTSLATNDQTSDLFVPDTVGPDYDCKTALAPLADHGVTDRVSVVSGLEIPAALPDQPIPAAGRANNFHAQCFGPLFSGTRTTLMQPVTAPSSDQIVGEAIGADTKIQCMAYRVQAAHYTDGPVRADAMSYRNGTQGLQKVTPKVSPALVFQELFDGFLPPGADPAAQAAAELTRRRRLSVLDLVGAKTEKLLAGLGQADRMRMEQHLDQIRDLETRIESLTIGAGGAGAACELPTTPDDPSLGVAYSDEDLRAEVLCDLIRLAFACDLSRAGSLMFTEAQCAMDMQFVTGYSKALHDVGHQSSLQDLSKCIGWHVKHFARLVSSLRDTQEIDGSSLLDHCALALVFEGGHGFDPQTGDQLRTHSTENMSALFAGGAGGMTQGRHVATAGKHPCAVINTAMRAVGVDTGFGEVTDTIPELEA